MSDKKRINIETDSDEPDQNKNWDEISNKDLDELPEDEFSVDEEGGEEGGGALEHLSYEELEEKLTEIEQLASKNRDGWLRTQAEFDNFKRRSERDLASAHKFGVEKLLLDLIPVLDSLDQGLGIKEFEEVQDDILHKVREGMELTYKMTLDTLTKYGVKQIDPINQPFNPEHHEAMTMQDNGNVPPNTVIQVFQKGYILHDRLIRAARVVVSK